MPGKACSHPGKPLENHLINTRDIALSMAEHYGLSLGEKEQYSILMHDIGKAHPAFHKRLCRACHQAGTCPDANHQPTDNAYNGHAAPSASLVMAETSNFVLAEAVRRHHGALQDLDEIKRHWVSREYTERIEELEALYPWSGMLSLGIWDYMPADFTEGFPEQDSWEDMCFDQLEILLPVKDHRSMSQLWLDLRKLYSLLVAADRWDATVSNDWQPQKWHYDPQKFIDFINQKYDQAQQHGIGELALWRSQLYEKVIRHAEQVMQQPGLYTLSLPTGAGKTLIGLAIASLAAQRFKATGIIYVLPFISLVDQNAGVAKQLFEQVQEDHYLAYVEEEHEDYGDQKWGQFLAFFRYWDMPIVVTTLSKFWETVYSPQANDAMSFHRLSRAVVVLDEPQTIPAEYWYGFGKTLELLSQQWHTTFILMTATQPAIVQGTELAPEKVLFPKNRHQIIWKENPLLVSELPDFLDERGWRVRDTLVIVNTREAALRTYLAARDRGLPAFLLSRWLTPHDRQNILQKLIDMEGKEQRCLIATQVVEAGVDRDFDLVFRDLAPFDSIVQAAGRCNRHAKRDKPGELWVVELKDDNNDRIRSLASYVYDKTLLNQTRTLLQEYGTLSEDQITDAVAGYYRRLSTAVVPDDIWTDIVRGHWGAVHPLYPEQVPEAALLIDEDGSIAQLLDELQSLPLGIESLARRRSINRRLGQHAVNVRQDFLEEWENRLGGFMIGDSEEVLSKTASSWWILHPQGIGKVYSPDAGFIPFKYSEQYASLAQKGVNP
jgi:CRISPR-associated endonuclease/helicase Cas3